MITVLGLDPASVKTGYAIAHGPDDVVDAGILLPCRTRDPAVQRVVDVGRELAALIDEHKPDFAVVEIPSGHVRGKFNGAGLTIYGMAVGYMLRVCVEKLPDARVECIDEQTWTAAVPKRRRQNAVATICKRYAQGRHADTGADAADAIGLLLYWFAVQQARAKVTA